MITKKLPKGSLYLAFQRVTPATESDPFMVEGYAFVNERIGNERIKWLRSAIEDATPEYLKWGNVREMHQPKACGVVRSAEWDAKGLFVRAEIVDAGVQEKIEKGVYKGFSMTLSPTQSMLRGMDVVKTRISDISVVDQPKDKDCPISLMARGEGFDGEDEEVEVEIVYQRGEFSEAAKGREKSTLRYMAFDVLSEMLYGIQGTGKRAETQARECIAEFADYLAPILARAELESPEEFLRTLQVGAAVLASIEKPDEFDYANIAVLTRAELDGLNTSISSLRDERDLARTELTTAQGDLTTVKERVKELENMPTTTPPAKYVAALNRTFQANAQEQGNDREELESELKRLMHEPGKTEDEKMKAATRISVIKSQLQEIG